MSWWLESCGPLWQVPQPTPGSSKSCWPRATAWRGYPTTRSPYLACAPSALRAREEPFAAREPFDHRVGHAGQVRLQHVGGVRRDPAAEADLLVVARVQDEDGLRRLVPDALERVPEAHRHEAHVARPELDDARPRG